MREELKIFENRSDDWYAKERAYEESISAWDLDDGRKLKQEHQNAHAKADLRKQYFKDYQNTKSRQSKKEYNFQDVSIQKKIVKTFVIMTLVITLLPTILILFADGIGEDFIFTILMLIFIVTMVLNSKQKGKRR